jgi:hypothetical protein
MPVNEDKIYYMHFRNGGQRGGVTIAVRRANETTFEFGIAICSPEDQFCRWLGRRIARGRMQKARPRGIIDPARLSGVVRCGPDEQNVPRSVWREALDEARSAVFACGHGGRFGYLLDSVFDAADDRLRETREEARDGVSA